MRYMGPKMCANFNTFEIAKLTKLKKLKNFYYTVNTVQW